MHNDDFVHFRMRDGYPRRWVSEWSPGWVCFFLFVRSFHLCLSILSVLFQLGTAIFAAIAVLLLSKIRLYFANNGFAHCENNTNENNQEHRTVQIFLFLAHSLTQSLALSQYRKCLILPVQCCFLFLKLLKI